VAFINIVSGRDDKFSMLVHTSGNTIDHRADKKPIEDVFQALADVESPKFAKAVLDMRKAAEHFYSPPDVERILDYVVANRSVYSIIVMNSERDATVDFKSATNPASLFTFVIGGNIVSRGVTFDNLLSMFFTRDAKHKIQQDTYIQRARMFGSRKTYLEHFELTIPHQLYVDWHRCFVFHKLSLEAIRAGLGSPVWVGDNRISPVSSSSVDQANVSLDRGEMSFGLFSYDSSFAELVKTSGDALSKLRSLQHRIGDKALPDYDSDLPATVVPFIKGGRISAFVVNSRFGVFVKHSSKRMSPWRFTFNLDQVSDLLDLEAKYFDSFVVFVCGTDGLVTLDVAALHQIVTFDDVENAWITIERRPRTQYGVRGNRAELPNKVANGTSLIRQTMELRSCELRRA